MQSVISSQLALQATIAFFLLLFSSSLSIAQDLYGGKSRPGDLIHACGSKGMGVDFVTGNCVSPQGRQTNPHNLYPPFTAPLPKPDPNDLIMGCGAQGRVADFVTGQCR